MNACMCGDSCLTSPCIFTRSSPFFVRTLASSGLNAFILNNETKKTILEDSLRCVGFKDDLVAFVKCAKNTAKGLVAEKDVLIESLLAHGHVLIRDAPLDPVLGRSPTDGRRGLEKKTDVPEFFQAVVGLLLGAELMLYPWKEHLYSSVPFHHGFAIPSNTTAALTAGKTLHWHLDAENLRKVSLMPAMLFLSCLRSDAEGLQVTKLLFNERILQFVPPHIQQILSQDRFFLPNKEGATNWKPVPQPILYNHHGHYNISTILALVDGPTAIRPAHDGDANAWKALHILQSAIATAETQGMARRLSFQPGDMLVFLNIANLHSRESFQEPYFDGIHDRIMIRSFWSSPNESLRGEGVQEVKWTTEADQAKSGGGPDMEWKSEQPVRDLNVPSWLSTEIVPTAQKSTTIPNALWMN